jgi:magnesium-protoporphyrin O-methyltransferase
MKRYLEKGPGPTTRLLRDGLADAGLLEGTLLDVGGGVGALSFELLDRGMARAVVVDASAAYLAVASEEATRRGRFPITEFVHGDFISVSDQLRPADVVTLDRVVCCYPFYQPLLERALRHAARGFAVSYPRDLWYVRVGVWFENALRRWRANQFRMFVHPASRMETLVTGAGFELVSRRRTWMWSADVFRKNIPAQNKAFTRPARATEARTDYGVLAANPTITSDPTIAIPAPTLPRAREVRPPNVPRVGKSRSVEASPR